MDRLTLGMDTTLFAGGFVSGVLDNLPIPFSNDPKGKDAIVMTPTGAPVFPLLSICNGTILFHTHPMESGNLDDSLSLALDNYSLSELVAELNESAPALGHSFSLVSGHDAPTAQMLYSFADFQLVGDRELSIPIVTSRLWKFIYPIAKAMHVAEKAGTDAESALELRFSSGFWLDFWGDWLDLPRLPGMTDAQYVAYMLFNFRSPKVTNMAIEDMLTAKFQVPFQVKDIGPHRFAVYIDAKKMGELTPDIIAPIVNKVKAAGVSWSSEYFVKLEQENYRSYFLDKNNGVPFHQSDKVSFQLNLSEPKKTVTESAALIMSGLSEQVSRNTSPPSLFGTSGGNLTSTVNNSGFFSNQRDSCEMFYTSRSDSSRTFL